MSEQEIQQQMDAMRALDEPMPQVGIFWYDPGDKAFFGVCKQELTPKQAEDAADQGLPFINYPHLHRQVWAKPIEAELAEMIEKEFALPYFEFVYDEHWDLGHGWSGDM